MPWQPSSFQRLYGGTIPNANASVFSDALAVNGAAIFAPAEIGPTSPIKTFCRVTSDGSDFSLAPNNGVTPDDDLEFIGWAPYGFTSLRTDLGWTSALGFYSNGGPGGAGGSGLSIYMNTIAWNDNGFFSGGLLEGGGDPSVLDGLGRIGFVWQLSAPTNYHDDLYFIGQTEERFDRMYRLIRWRVGPSSDHGLHTMAEWVVSGDSDNRMNGSDVIGATRYRDSSGEYNLAFWILSQYAGSSSGVRLYKFTPSTNVVTQVGVRVFESGVSKATSWDFGIPNHIFTLFGSSAVGDPNVMEIADYRSLEAENVRMDGGAGYVMPLFYGPEGDQYPYKLVAPMPPYDEMVDYIFNDSDSFGYPTFSDIWEWRGYGWWQSRFNLSTGVLDINGTGLPGIVYCGFSAWKYGTASPYPNFTNISAYGVVDLGIEDNASVEARTSVTDIYDGAKRSDRFVAMYPSADGLRAYSLAGKMERTNFGTWVDGVFQSAKWTYSYEPPSAQHKLRIQRSLYATPIVEIGSGMVCMVVNEVDNADAIRPTLWVFGPNDTHSIGYILHSS